MRRLLPALAFGLAFPAGLWAQLPAPLTKLSVRAMPTAVLTRRLFGELGRIMLPDFPRGRPGVRPTTPLRDLEFLTIPHASPGAAGLCETQAVTVRFAAAGPPRGAATIVTPSGIETGTNYFPGDPVRLRNAGGLDDAEQPRLDARCRAIDPRTRNLFWARNAEAGGQGWRLLVALVEAARASRVAATLDCSQMAGRGDPPFTAETCRQTVAGFDPNHLQSVDICGSEPVWPPRCYEVSIDDIALRFRLGAQGAVEQVALQRQIVFRDARID